MDCRPSFGINKKNTFPRAGVIGSPAQRPPRLLSTDKAISMMKRYERFAFTLHKTGRINEAIHFVRHALELSDQYPHLPEITSRIPDLKDCFAHLQHFSIIKHIESFKSQCIDYVCCNDIDQALIHINRALPHVNKHPNLEKRMDLLGSLNKTITLYQMMKDVHTILRDTLTARHSLQVLHLFVLLSLILKYQLQHPMGFG